MAVVGACWGPAVASVPRYWVNESDVREQLRDRWEREWLVGWRDICRATDERTMILSVLPMVGVGHTMPLVFPEVQPAAYALLIAAMSYFVFDYVARQKAGGTHMTYGFLKQLPLPLPSAIGDTPRWESGRGVP